MGRHKTVISPKDMAEAKQLAYDGCMNGTICGLMDWDEGWLAQRPDILSILKKKRQERSRDLRRAQNEKAIEAKDTTMLIWLGKNALGQTDKRDVTTGGERINVPVSINVSASDLAELGAKAEDLIPKVD